MVLSTLDYFKFIFFDFLNKVKQVINLLYKQNVHFGLINVAVKSWLIN